MRSSIPKEKIKTLNSFSLFLQKNASVDGHLWLFKHNFLQFSSNLKENLVLGIY